MSNQFFAKFPLVEYEMGGQTFVLKNLASRAVIKDSVGSDPFAYQPYEFIDGERADQLAERYYGDEYLSWLVYLSGDVVDPYHDLPITDSEMNAIVESEHGTVETAISRISHWRNNWYAQADDRKTPAQLATLSTDQKRYWEVEAIDKTGAPLAYRRSQNDWTLNTNAIASVTSPTGAEDLIDDEVVDVYLSGGVVATGRAQVMYRSTTELHLKHLIDDVLPSTSVPLDGDAYLKGRDSEVTVAISGMTLITRTIPLEEQAYWTPVTYYDVAEEKNSENRSIKLLASSLSSQANQELETLLSGNLA